jgi:hypothetical protein
LTSRSSNTHAAVRCAAILIASAAAACGNRTPASSANDPHIALDIQPPDGRSFPRIVLTIDSPIEWTLHFKNDGTVPALHVATRAAVVTHAYASTEVDAFFTDLPKRLPATGSVDKSMPGERSEKAITARSKDVATPEDFTATAHDQGLYLVGRFEYESESGRACRTDFCRYTVQSGAPQACPTHNESRCGP